MKLKDLKQILDAYADTYGDWDVRIEVTRRNAMGGTPTVDIRAIAPGFDWDHHKIIVRTEVPLKEITKEEKRDINIDDVIG